LTLFPILFQNYTNAFYWKVDFRLKTQYATGQASLISKNNLLPSNGDCFIDKTYGKSLSTWFTIECVNWQDPDGFIKKYEYMGKYEISTSYL
jgi:hypothetical protein